MKSDTSQVLGPLSVMLFRERVQSHNDPGIATEDGGNGLHGDLSGTLVLNFYCYGGNEGQRSGKAGG